MERELSYLNPEGFTVFTSYFHRKRGYCCESLCLHCPYGLTVKKFGLGVTPMDLNDRSGLIALLKKEFPGKILDDDNLTAYAITLKGYLCGFFLKVGSDKELLLREHFKDQDLTLQLIEKEMMALNKIEDQ